MRDDNLYRLSLQSRHTKAVKAYDAEIEIDIWNDAAAEVFHVGYMAKPHDPIFQHLRNIISKHFKRNVYRIFVLYMVDNYGTSRSVRQGETSREGERYLEAGLEALELFISLPS